MEVVTLKGITQKGKQRIAMWGSRYVVRERQPRKMLVESVREIAEHPFRRDLRWVDVNDADFMVSK